MYLGEKTSLRWVRKTAGRAQEGCSKKNPCTRSPEPWTLLQVIASAEFDRLHRGGDDKPVEEITEIIVFGQIFDIGA